jgi:hypothetical protein
MNSKRRFLEYRTLTNVSIDVDDLLDNTEIGKRLRRRGRNKRLDRQGYKTVL